MHDNQQLTRTARVFTDVRVSLYGLTYESTIAQS
jgi:hypothetical protein